MVKEKSAYARLLIGEITAEEVSKYSAGCTTEVYHTHALERDCQSPVFFSLPYLRNQFDSAMVGKISISNPLLLESLMKEIARVCCGDIIVSPVARGLFHHFAEQETVFSPPQNPDMRVLVLSYMFPSVSERVNGIFVYDQVRALMEGGNIDVRVVSGKAFWMGGGPLRLWKEQKNYGNAVMNLKARLLERGWFCYRKVPATYVPYRINRPLQLLSLQSESYEKSMMNIIDEVRETFPFDLIHAHTSYLDGSAAKALSERYGVPYVITEHTGPFSMLLRTPHMKKRTLAAIEGAAAIYGVSEAQRDTIRGYLPKSAHVSSQDKVGVMYNGVIEEEFMPQPPPERENIFLTFIGYLVPVKNIHLLLEAFDRISRDSSDIHLHLVGQGELEGRLKKQAEAAARPENIHFAGMIEHEKIPDFIRQNCDILVLPSQSESFGMVVAEAAALGKPSVISKCGGAESVVVDERIGEVCEVGDVDSLESALRRAIDRYRAGEYDPAYISEYAHAKFGVKAVCGKLLEEYRKVLSTAPQGEAK